MSNTLSFARRETGRRDLETLKSNFGPLIWSRLEDLSVTDVLLNGNGSLFEDREGAGLTCIGTMDEYAATSVINQVAAVAGEIVNRDSPIIEATLPIRGARFIGYVPPITQKPSFAIRLPPSKIYAFTDYVEAKMATPQQIKAIETAIYQEDNILISGGTASGKSTLMNAVLNATSHIYPNKRVGLIEEITELQCTQQNVLALRTGSNADHQDLLKRLMRSRPDILVFGEVRDKAALQLVKAGNTGHGSVLSTIHANSPRRALGRMEDLCAEALPGVSVRSQIADVGWVVIGIERIDPDKRVPGGPPRRLTEIIEVKGITNGEYDFVTLA
jgi:type IV secretion system protein TrbB